ADQRLRRRRPPAATIPAMANTEVNHVGPRNGNGAEGNAPVATLVATVSTLLTEAPEAARLAGEKLQRVLAGRLEQANVTVPLNPLLRRYADAYCAGLPLFYRERRG